MQPQTLSMCANERKMLGICTPCESNKGSGCRGDGYSHTSHGQVQWRQGDVWVFPGSEKITHHASKESTEHGGAAFYWVTDEPLCKYLGVTSVEEKFEPAHFTKEVLPLVQSSSSNPGLNIWVFVL